MANLYTKYRPHLLVLGISFFVWSCLGDGRVNAGFSVSWTIEDADGALQSCDMLGADRVSVTALDAEGEGHTYRATCEAGSFETPEWEIATGEGTVSAVLEDEGGLALAEVPGFAVEFAGGRNANALPVLRFVVPAEVTESLGPRVDISLQLDAGNGAPVQCENLGTGFLSFALTDAAGTLFELGASPCDASVFFSTKLSRVPAPGKASLEVAFRTPSFKRIADQTVPLELALGDVVIGPLKLLVQPRAAWGDSGISWQWTYKDAFPDDAACGALGFDYAVLYVRDDASKTWWTDPLRLIAPCAAYDHPGDDAVFGTDAYAGVFATNALPSGDYHLSLAWFRKSGAQEALGADTLAAFDLANPGNDDGPNGTLRVDAQGGVNRLTTDLSKIVEKQGDLTVSLSWENDAEGHTACLQTGVVQMGAYLESAYGPASSLLLSDAYGCQDVLRFPGLPKAAEPYSLAVYGVDGEGRMRWYAYCTDLFPATMGDSSRPTGYPCLVPHLTLP